MRWISREQVISIHSDIIKEFGGKGGIRDEALLDAALNAPFQTFGGDDLFPDVIEKSARMAFGIIRNHPFLDGNKRMATHLMLIMLSLNGIKIAYDDDELIRLILLVADGQADGDDILRWIRAHIGEGNDG